jgi:hypothetical protein
MKQMARWFGATEPTQSADRVAGTGSERKVSVSETTCVLCIAEVVCWVISFWSFCVFWEVCLIFGQTDAVTLGDMLDHGVGLQECLTFFSFFDGVMLVHRSKSCVWGK